ncbi:MAG: hypothetical protein CSB01_00085 [Bacteroidia bacterium]|nr:MAG: hypothetical protein CSB01_00085 [Bacteroidia bacterium]
MVIPKQGEEMKRRIKPVLIILVTLAIGFALGVLTTGQFIGRQMKKFKERNTEKGFVNYFNQILNTDEEQKKVLNPILKKYGAIYKEATKTYLFTIDSGLNAFEAEVTPHLKQKQIEKLECFKKHRNKFKNGFSPYHRHKGNKKRRKDK